MHSRISLLTCLLMLTAFLLPSGCQKSATPSTADSQTFFPMLLGNQPFEARIAVLPHERSKGLMYVESLGDHQGMLFFSSRPEQQSFWMRNTLIPLDIGFFDARGQLLEVHPMFPHDETPVRSHSNAILFALEMPQGWFRQYQLFPDQRPQLDLKLIRNALNDRGLDQHMQNYIP